MPRKSAESPSKATSRPPKVHISWTDEEATMLLNLVEEHKASAGDGLNFKNTFWNTVAATLPAPTKGGPKTAVSCKDKWKRVRISFRSIN